MSLFVESNSVKVDHFTSFRNLVVMQLDFLFSWTCYSCKWCI